MKHLSGITAVFTSLLFTVAYGALVVWLFDQPNVELESFTWSFIMLLPYAIGLIGNLVLMRRREMGLVEAAIWPWVYTAAVAVAVLAASFGLLLCLVISAPIFLPAASLGGITAWVLARHPKTAVTLLSITLLSPFLAAPVEAQFTTPITVTTTHTYIDIDASKETIWHNITSVAPISDAEQSTHWLHWLGIPRPLSADLSYEGVGGVRVGNFENGLRFDETIYDWTLYEQMSFDIVESSGSLLPRPLDMVDGEYFDVLSGEYRLEELPNGMVRLHFSSDHQLETRFNSYGAWWMDLVMRNLQDYILEIIKARAEGS